MRLSTRVRYGTRTMVNLAKAYPERTISVKELAENLFLSAKYLEHIMASLKASRLIRVVRGKNGGYMLAKDPSTIKLKDIYEALEGPLLLVDCVEDSNACPQTESCVTRGIWTEVTDAIQEVFDRITIKNLAEKSQQNEACPNLAKKTRRGNK